MTGRREQRSTAWAVAVSLVLHAALIVYLGTRPRQTLPDERQPIEVTLISVPPLPIEPEPPKPEPKEEEPKPEPPRPAPKKIVRAQAEPAPEPKPEPEPEPEQVAKTDAPVDDMPRRVPDLPSKPAMVGGLAPSATWTLGIDAGVDLAERPRGIRAPEVPDDLAKDAVKKTLGRGRVDRGLVNTYYATLGKALIKTWDADRAVSQFGLKGYVEQFGENTKIWNNIWQSNAAQFGKTGNPFGDDSPDTDPYRGIDNRQAGQGYDLASRKALQKKMGDAFKQTKRATIRVVQNTEGRLLKVELVEPSNDTRVDNEALADVRAAAEKLPVPTPDVIEGKDTLSSLWQFELIVSISPPIPTLTFEFDEALGFIDARLPLDRRIYKRVRLVSVE